MYININILIYIHLGVCTHFFVRFLFSCTFMYTFLFVFFTHAYIIKLFIIALINYLIYITCIYIYID